MTSGLEAVQDEIAIENFPEVRNTGDVTRILIGDNNTAGFWSVHSMVTGPS